MNLNRRWGFMLLATLVALPGAAQNNETRRPEIAAQADLYKHARSETPRTYSFAKSSAKYSTSSSVASESSLPEDFSPKEAPADLAEKLRQRSFLRHFRRGMVGTPALPQNKVEMKSVNRLGAGAYARMTPSQRQAVQKSKAGATAMGFSRDLRSNAAPASKASPPPPSPMASSFAASSWSYDEHYVDFDYIDYRNNMEQLWYTYYAPIGTTQIAVDFSWIDLEPNYDFVEIYDKYGLCAYYSGDSTSFTSTNCYGNYVDIWVVTDGSTSGNIYDGFSIRGFYNYSESLPGRPPVALGLASSYAPRTGDTVYFDAGSSYDPDGSSYNMSYYWTFGDGTTSTSKYPSKRYSSPGTYLVVLRVQDETGLYDYDSFYMTVTATPPNPDFSLKTTPISTTSDAVIYPVATNATSMLIEWGDGESLPIPNYSYTSAGFRHRYAAPGVYPIKLKATNSGGTTVKIVNITVTGEEQPPRLYMYNATAVNATQGKAYGFTPGFWTVDDGALSTFSIDWGGGTDLVGSIENYTAAQLPGTRALGSYMFTRPHQYYKMNGTAKRYIAGLFTMTARATDNKGLTATVNYVYATKNVKPVVTATITNTCVTQACSFKQGGVKPLEQTIYDTDGTISSYGWQFFRSDKKTLVAECPTVLNTREATCVFPAPGAYQVRLRAGDNLGLYTDVWKAVTVTNPKPVVAAVTKSCVSRACNFVVGAGKAFDVAVKDTDGIASTKWEFLDKTKTNEVCPAVEGSQTASCVFPDDGTFYARFTAKDRYGVETVVLHTTAIANKKPALLAVTKSCVSRACNFVVGAGKAFDVAVKDPDGTIASTKWEFFNAAKTVKVCADVDNSQTATCAFPADGTFYARLTATDNYGGVTQVWHTTAVANKKPTLLALTHVCTGRNCSVTVGAGKAYDVAVKDADGTIVSAKWEFFNRALTATVCPEANNVQTASCTFSAAGTYNARLTVTDNDGGVTQVVRAITVK